MDPYQRSDGVETTAVQIAQSTGHGIIARSVAAPEQPRAVSSVGLPPLADLAEALRNPMQAIAGYLEILADEWLSDLAPRPREIVDRIRARAAMLSRTIENLLEAADADAGSEACADEEIATADLIADLILTLQAAAEGGSVHLLTEVAAAPHSFRSNLRRIRSILFNLALGAIQRTPGGAITISVAGVPADSDSPESAIRFEIRASYGQPDAEPFEHHPGSLKPEGRGGFVAALISHHLAALGASLEIKQDCAHSSRAVFTVAGRRRCESGPGKGGSRPPIRTAPTALGRRTASSAMLHRIAPRTTRRLSQ